MIKSLSLAGVWRVCLDGTHFGDTLPSNEEFVSGIQLPATTETAGLGPINPDHRTDRLTAVRRIEGPVWYQREIEIPADWSDRDISLFIERTKWCRVFLDDHLLGDDPILCAPHHIPLGNLSPGPHRFTLCVDNSRRPAPGDNHQSSEHTQGNWNGLLGRLELRATSDARIEHIAVVPDVAGRAFHFKIQLGAFENVGRGRRTPPSVGKQAGYGDPALQPNQGEASRLHIQAESYNHSGEPHRPAPVSLALSDQHRGLVELTLPLGPDAQLWDEFSPALYRFTITLNSPLDSDEHVLTTGLREFRTRGTQFTINGRTTFLRGEVNCCVFPLTGHPPMEVEGWLRYYRTLQEYGINHVRFHSWTPPDAAFTAADELGIYVQTELPFWGEWNEDVRRALQPEGEAILRAFGHHPSFVLLSLGNEHRGDRTARARLVAHLRQFDPHRLYCEGANNDLETPSLAPADDCWITVRVPDPANTGRYTNVRGCFATNDGANGHLQIGPAGTRTDYAAAITGITMPIVSHEIGQFTVSPNFAEIERYTGVFAAHNLERFRSKAAAAGILDQSDAAFRASGKLAALLYREEIEAALRTPGFGGFQLLGLQDFPGQGTALVGLLDAFMESKGAITPAEFRQFCAPHVLLARFDRHSWTAGEIFRADLDLAHYGPVDLAAGSIKWELRSIHADEIVGRDRRIPPVLDGKAGYGDPALQPKQCDTPGENINEPLLANGSMPVPAATQGGVRRLGSLQLTLPNLTAAKRVDLILRYNPGSTGGPASPRAVAVDDSNPIQISYPLWIYPAETSVGASKLAPTGPNSAKLVRHFDSATQAALASGGSVVLIPDAAHPFAHSPGGGFMTDFWCWPMFYNTPGTMGLLIDPGHPALAGFPTETHSNWQWYHLAQAAQPVVLDVLPVSLRPIVQVIDNLDRVHRLGLIFEARVGDGRLLVCALDLPALTDQHPEARQLLASILAYSGSEQFAPTDSLDLSVLSRALEARLPLVGAKLSASTARPNRDPFVVLNARAPTSPDTALNVVGEWWQTDFPAPVDFDAVELVWDKEQARYRASVEITDDGLSWHLLSKVGSGDAPLRYHRVNAAARGARGVRVRVNGLSTDSVIGLNELRLIRPQG